MSEHETIGKKYVEAGTKCSWRALWMLVLTVLVLALACLWTTATVAPVMMGERDTIQGSGTVIAEDRPVGHFQRLSLCDLGTVILSQGDEEKLSIETDDNLIRYVESQVRGGTLVLYLNDEAKARGIVPSKEITYRLSVRHLSGLEVADSGRIQAGALDVDSLEISVHDSGNVAIRSLVAHRLQVDIGDSGQVRLAGRVEEQAVILQDSGRYLASGLQSWEAAVVASDSVEATLWVTDALDVSVADSGRVCYYGQPRRVQHLSDRGSLAGLGEP